MKRKLADNEVDSVAGGGTWITDEAKIQKIKQDICPYCGGSLKESWAGSNGFIYYYYACYPCKIEFVYGGGGWKEVPNGDNGC